MSDDNATSIDAKPYPLDVGKLNKGDYIPPEECERIAGIKRSHPRYSLKLCSICGLIQAKWADERSEIVTIRQEDNGIRICDDQTAVLVNDALFHSGLRKVRRCNYQINGVDRENLDEFGKLHQERVSIISGAYISGGRRAARAELKAHERQTPLLTGNGSK